MKRLQPFDAGFLMGSGLGLIILAAEVSSHDTSLIRPGILLTIGLTCIVGVAVAARMKEPPYNHLKELADGSWRNSTRFDPKPRKYQPKCDDCHTHLCLAGRDGECNWDLCPQLRDKEPETTGRHCPYDSAHRDCPSMQEA